MMGDNNRSKPHIHVGTIGHDGRGKITLTAAIITVLAKTSGEFAGAFNQIDSAPVENVGGITINTSHVSYDTLRHFEHTDPSGHSNVVKNMIIGAPQLDCAILVVAATDGPMPQTREHILLARQTGVSHLIVFLNNEMETRDLLSQCGYPGDDVPIIHGAAVKALDGDPECEGKIVELAGIIHVGDAVEIVGIRDTISTTCTGFGVGKALLDESRAGETCAVLLRGIQREDLQQGQVIAKPGSVMPHTQFEAAIYVLRKDEGGRSTPFSKAYRPQFYLRTTNIWAWIELPKDVEFVWPGDVIQMVVTLVHPIAIEHGLRFAMTEGGRTVGAGVVSRIVS
ncbi:MAG: hypothetical protein Q9207_000339 [Kuettlingeria erythrocarpa]